MTNPAAHLLQHYRPNDLMRRRVLRRPDPRKRPRFTAKQLAILAGKSALLIGAAGLGTYAAYRMNGGPFLHPPVSPPVGPPVGPAREVLFEAPDADQAVDMEPVDIDEAALNRQVDRQRINVKGKGPVLISPENMDDRIARHRSLERQHYSLMMAATPPRYQHHVRDAYSRL